MLYIRQSCKLLNTVTRQVNPWVTKLCYNNTTSLQNIPIFSTQLPQLNILVEKKSDVLVGGNLL